MDSSINPVACNTITFDMWCEEHNIVLSEWQSLAARDFLAHIVKRQQGRSGKSFLVKTIEQFVNEHGNDFAVDLNAYVETVQNRAFVLVVNGRYFRKFSKNGRVITAWSIAGAKLFGEWRDELSECESRLARKGLKSRRVFVGLL